MVGPELDAEPGFTASPSPASRLAIGSGTCATTRVPQRFRGKGSGFRVSRYGLRGIRFGI
jgi:hypothetical protein